MWALKSTYESIKTRISGSNNNNNNEENAPKETDPEVVKKQEEDSKRRKERIKFGLTNILAVGVHHITKSHAAGEAVKTALEVGWEATELTIETRKEVNEVKLFLAKQDVEFNDARFFQLAELCAWLSYHAYEPKDASDTNPVMFNEKVSLNFKYKEVLKLMDKHVFWFVAQDTTRNIVYIVFRGTSVAGDVVIDLYADLHADDIIKDYMAHSGIYQSINKELDAIKEAIQNCNVNEKTYFVLTGHSLGGGLATMLYTYMKTKSDYQNNRMIVLTFGAPLVLAPKDNGWPETLQSISKDVHNFVHNADIIPRVLGNENVKLLPMIIGLLKKTVGEAGAGMLLEGLSMKGEKLEERLGKYRPYGEIYLLYGQDKVLRASSDEEKRKILSLPAVLCFEVLTQPKKVFEHHGIGLYLDFLKAAAVRERERTNNN